MGCNCGPTDFAEPDATNVAVQDAQRRVPTRCGLGVEPWPLGEFLRPSSGATRHLLPAGEKESGTFSPRGRRRETLTAGSCRCEGLLQARRGVCPGTRGWRRE